MSRKSKRNFGLTLCFVSVFLIASIPVFLWRIRDDNVPAVDYAPLSYMQMLRDPLNNPFAERNPFEIVKSIQSQSGIHNRITRRPMALHALSSFSREFEVIYEMRGLRTRSIDWPQYQSQELLRHYSFVSYNGRVANFFFDHGNEIIPKIHYNIHGLQYVDKSPFSDSETISWIGLMTMEDNFSFALVDVLRPIEYYREFQWSQNKFIVEFEFVDSEYIKITYIDKNQVSNYEEMIIAFRGYLIIADIVEGGFVNYRINWSPGNDWPATPDDFRSYLTHTVISLDSYINAVSPMVDYRYEFINNGSVSEYVTKSNFHELRLFHMNKEAVNHIFQIEGVLVERYTDAGNTFEIYGYLGENVAIFVIFYGDLLVAAEFLDPRFYR